MKLLFMGVMLSGGCGSIGWYAGWIDEKMMVFMSIIAVLGIGEMVLDREMC